jgi:hypothetical protein
MNCEKAKSLLNSFYDGELTAADHKLVGEHIKHCPDCAAELAAFTDLDRASRQLVPPDPPAELWERISERLLVHGPLVAAVRTRSLGRRRFFAAAGILAASLVGGFLTYRITHPRNADDAGVLDLPIIPGGMRQPQPILVNHLNLLSPDDRRAVESQQTCAADGCVAQLGADGPPVKLVLQKKTVFFCCEECEQWGIKHPAQTLTKLHKLLEHQRSDQKKP